MLPTLSPLKSQTNYLKKSLEEGVKQAQQQLTTFVFISSYVLKSSEL